MKVPLPVGAGEDVVKAGCLAGQDVDDLVRITVCGGLGQAERDAVQADIGFGAESGQGERGLMKAGQAPGGLGGAAVAALVAEQAVEVADRFTGDVEHGGTGDHVGLSAVKDLG
ncbi:hypothetical protein GCM10017673_53250 [Streptosporangium violaceochromogenes]|nr:hypothetical protein GCM10017673_53250 [Streptosporangium violaceochromogenes]